jgi:hypothetical protein
MTTYFCHTYDILGGTSVNFGMVIFGYWMCIYSIMMR